MAKVSIDSIGLKKLFGIKRVKIIEGYDYRPFADSMGFKRKALPEELPDDIMGEPELPTSFSNLRKIEF